MKKLMLLMVFLCFVCTFVYGEKEQVLWDATQSKQISVSANWNTRSQVVFGQNLIVKITNLKPEKIKILILPGETFLSQNPDYQNQIVVKAETMILEANASDTISLFSMCIGHKKQSPGSGNEFSLIAQKDVLLVDVAHTIASYGYHNSSTAQAAIWTVQGSASISTIYSTDSTMASRLAGKVASLTNLPKPTYFPLREHHIVVLNGNFNYQAIKPITVTLGVYDSTGKVVNLLMNRKRLLTGFHTFKYHANEVAPEGTRYFLKMTNEQGEMLYSKILSEAEVVDTKTFSQRIMYGFTLDKGYKELSLGIYNTKGVLMAEIFGYKPWAMGTYNINYTLHHEQEADSVFYVRLVDKDKKVLKQKLVRKKTIGDDQYPLETLEVQLKYPIAHKVDHAKAVVYNEYGDEIAAVFEDRKLNPGPNEIKYKLKHTYGKKARFILQVLGPTGLILFSKELVQAP